MSGSWDPDDDELGDILNEILNWPGDDDGTPPAGELPDLYAQQVFTAAFAFGSVDEAYEQLLDDETIPMRSAGPFGVTPFAFGNDELSAEGELGPGDLVIGRVQPPGPATVRVDAMSGVQTVEADELGRFELTVTDRLVRIVVTRDATVRTSGWRER